MVGSNSQVDLALPSTVPIAAMLDELAALVESRTAGQGEFEDAPIPIRHWTLARIGHDPISPESTLAEARVRDGELLILRARSAVPVPALFDDVIDAVARLTEDTFHGWTATSARWMAIATALIAAPAALVLLVMAKNHGHDSPAAVTAIGAGVAALVAATIAARVHARTAVAVTLTSCGLVLVGPGAALLIPTRFGSAHLMLACAADLLVAVLAYRVTGVGASVVAAAVTIATLSGVAAAAMVIWHHPPAKVGAAMVAAALVVLSGVARLSALAARLPVPPVPAAGGRVDPADHDPRPTIAGIGAVGAATLAQAAGLAERAKIANEYQSGFVIGCVAVAVAGALTAAGDHRWQGMALAMVAGSVLSLRGRTFADLTQAATLIGGGALTFAGVLIMLGYSRADALVPSAVILLVLGACALAATVAGDSADPSPVLRRAGELAEYALIVTTIPLVLWTTDLFALARSV